MSAFAWLGRREASRCRCAAPSHSVRGQRDRAGVRRARARAVARRATLPRPCARAPRRRRSRAADGAAPQAPPSARDLANGAPRPLTASGASGTSPASAARALVLSLGAPHCAAV